MGPNCKNKYQHLSTSMEIIPFFGIKREYSDNKDIFLQLIDESLSTGLVLRGSEVARLEEIVKKLCERRYSIAVNSATDGLFFALKALGIGPGDEVLVTDFSFIASASCILRCGAKPVFVDINDDYNIDLTQIEAKVTPRTKAVIVVHLFGQMINPEALFSTARKYNLFLVEDAAQAFGAKYNEVPAGSIGDISIISFDPTKVIGAPGNGGIVLTDSENLANIVKLLRYHGKNQAGEFITQGFNSQMSSIVANILCYKISKMDEWYNRRKQIASYYSSMLRTRFDMHVPNICDNHSHIFHKYVIRTHGKEKLLKYLQKKKIEIMIHYPKALHENFCFLTQDIESLIQNNASLIAQEVLSLPIHPFLTDNEIQHIVDSIIKYFKK